MGFRLRPRPAVAPAARSRDRAWLWLRAALLGAALGLPTLVGLLRSWDTPAAETLRLGWHGVTVQSSANSCGPAVIATILAWSGSPVGEAAVMEQARLGERGVSLSEFARLAALHGLPGGWRRADLVDLERLPLPSVVHLAAPAGHFAILTAVGHGYAYLVDPARGRLLLTRGAFAREYTGRAFVFESPPSGWS